MGLLSRDPVASNPVRVLTAAAQQIRPSESGKQARFRGGEAWQKQAWDFYDQVGELHYAVSFYAGCMRRVKLRIALRDYQGNVTAAWDDEGNPLHAQVEEAQEQLRGLRPSIGGHGELLAAQAGNVVVAGECYLVGELADDGLTQSVASWETLSVEELVEESGKFKKVTASGEKQDLNTIEDPIRIWKAHLRHTQRADSSVRPLLEILDEIVLLTRGVRATTMSRLAGAGVLWVPNEIEVPKDPDSPEDQDQFVVDLINAMTTPISDKASASAVVPMVVRAPGDMIDKVQHTDFTRNFDSYPSVELRKEAVRRFAQGIDLPMEIVTGQGGTNHWSAWQIDESTFKAHIEPVAEIIVDGLTDWLENRLGERRVEAGVEVIVHYDPSELVAHPNQANDGKDAYDRVLISGATYRGVLGFSERDAPDEEEIAKRLEWEKAKRPTGSPGGDPSQNADEVEPGPPDNRAQTMETAMEAATDVAVERALDRFGARLRSKLNGKTGLREVVDGVANDQIARTIGMTKVRQIMGEGDLFPAEFAALRRTVIRQAQDLGYGWTEASQFGYLAEKNARLRAIERLDPQMASV